MCKTRSTGEVVTTSWVEWIEPLTIQTRHPFAHADCPSDYFTDYLRKHKKQMKFTSSITGVDYVLLQAGEALIQETTHVLHPISVPHNSDPHNHTAAVAVAAHSHTIPVSVNKSAYYFPAARHQQKRVRNLLFDAGTSLFPSSLVWFVCGYLQRGTSS